MTVRLPFFTDYDPPGASEGTLDPLGLYQIADQLAVQLVPGVRERMQRIRFLTAMVVGAHVTADMEDDPRHQDASPHLVWEWLIVEAFIRQMRDDEHLWGVPGTLVAKRAVDSHGYLDAPSYLKTPRVFGFHGVYKRLAVQLGLVNVHLRPGPNAAGLVDAWAKARGFGGLEQTRPLLARWTGAVRRSVEQNPPRTMFAGSSENWRDLAQAFAPFRCKNPERTYLRRLLLGADSDNRLGALPEIWELIAGRNDNELHEEFLHKELFRRHAQHRALLAAIRAYESFARRLQDAFDVLRADAARLDGTGYVVQDVGRIDDFRRSVDRLHEQFETAHDALGVVSIAGVPPQHLFKVRFGAFAEPMDAGACALTLCRHHEEIQRGKSAEGKRPWFDRIGPERIFIRHGFRLRERPKIQPGRYVHEYRAEPIRRFHGDLR